MKKNEDRVLEPDELPIREAQSYAHEKLHFAGGYMSIFATGMKNLWTSRVYLDLLAGPGRCRIDGRDYPGSPLRSLEALFTKRIFIEADTELAAALRRRLEVVGAPADTQVIDGDCNSDEAIATLRAATAGGLGLAFVDNLGLDVPFRTLAELTRNRHIDLMIVFQLQDLNRNIPMVLKDEQDRSRVDAFFGTPDWEKVARAEQASTTRPGAIGDALLSFYLDRLKTIGYDHAVRGVQVMKNERNAAQYRLLLAGKHERATDFFRKIERYDYHGQRGLWP